MPEITGYEQGVPSWVDLAATDLPASIAFYSSLFGWEAHDQGEEAGHYTIMTKGGKQVAAVAPAQRPGPAYWTTYVNVEDLDAVAKRAEAAGATVILPPMDVMTAGRMAIFSDTTGAVIAGWQPQDHIGAQLVNESGSFTWSELTTSDLTRSKAFYTEVFGWTWGGTDDYAEAKVADREIAGAMPRRPDLPADVPDNWLVYFGCDDVDADTVRATGLGATVVVEPMDIPGTGRFSVVIDPQGAALGLFKG